jgi:hypothetical protein
VLPRWEYPTSFYAFAPCSAMEIGYEAFSIDAPLRRMGAGDIERCSDDFPRAISHPFVFASAVSLRESTH